MVMFKQFVKFMALTGITASVIYISFMSGAYFHPVVSYAQVEVQKIVEPEYPVLNRIGGCESTGKASGIPTQTDKNGQVLTHANTNKTVDIGAYQINITVWGAKAHALGYDLSKLEGNKSMATWIYKNKGTGDWSASRQCWQ